MGLLGCCVVFVGGVAVCEGVLCALFAGNTDLHCKWFGAILHFWDACICIFLEHFW